VPDAPAPVESRVPVAIAWPVNTQVLLSASRVSAETTRFQAPASVRLLPSTPTADWRPSSRSMRSAAMPASSIPNVRAGARSSIPIAPIPQRPALPVSRTPSPGSAIRREKNRFTGVWK